jgi:hypothetical protein
LRMRVLRKKGGVDGLILDSAYGGQASADKPARRAADKPRCSTGVTKINGFWFCLSDFGVKLGVVEPRRTKRTRRQKTGQT